MSPRLRVGPAGDHHEREADTIAAQVMAMRDADVATVGSAAPSEVLTRRACASCADTDRIQRLGAETEHETQDGRTTASNKAIARDTSDAEEDQVQRRGMHRPTTAGLAASEAELTSGGRPLPDVTRRFYEPRLGRDLSKVRVHRGDHSEHLNDSIAARAFTYRDHIWLGPSEGTGPSFTMAHELAHVLQQTAPGPVGPQAMREGASPVAAPRVQRASCGPGAMDFFFPKGFDVPNVHHDRAVEHATGKTKNMRGEVRVPNANANGFTADPGRFGFADLVEANDSSVVGLGMTRDRSSNGAGTQRGPATRPWFVTASSRGLMRPVNLDFWATKRHFKNGRSYSGTGTNKLYSIASQPRWNPAVNDLARDSTHAPTELKIGDMKFAGGRDKAADATRQVERYVSGFEFARDQYNEMAKRSAAAKAGDTSITGSSARTLPAWSLTVGKTDASTKPTKWTVAERNIPLIVGKWAPRRAPQPGQSQMKVVKCDDSLEYKGKLLYRNSPNSAALWEYLFWPNKDSRQFDQRERKLIARYQARAKPLQLELFTTPTGKKVSTRRDPTRRTASADRGRSVRPAPKNKKPLPTKDPFIEKFSAWKAKQKKLTADFTAFGGTRKGKKALSALLHDIALKNTLDRTGGKAPDGGKTPTLTDQQFKTDIRKTATLYRMTGSTGDYLGLLRKTFGSAFIRVVTVYQRLRARFAEFMRKKGGRARSKGLGKAVLKVGGAIFGAIFHQIMPEVAHLLLDCVEQGISKMFKKLVETDLEALVGNQITKLEKELEDIQRQITAAIEKVVGAVQAKLSGRFEKIMQVWETVGTLVGVAKTAFNTARVAACAAGGLETVGIACVIAGADFLLSLIGLSPAEALASSLLGTCVAQQMIGKHILARKEIKALPRFIADTILTDVRTHLPPKIRPLLCERITASAQLPDIGEITCGKGGSISGGEANASWKPPSSIPSSVLNRKPTAKDLQEGGRLPPITPKPRRPGPGTTDPSSPPEGAGGTSRNEPGGSASERRHGVHEGVLSGKTEQVSVNFMLELRAGEGLRHGDHDGKTVFSVLISATDSNGVHFGPDLVEIRVFNVKRTTQGDRVIFAAARDYILTSDDTGLQLTKDRQHSAGMRRL